MVEKTPGFIQRHTQQGRYDEYRAKYAHILAESSGVSRYTLERKLEHDAKKYAQKKVAQDMLAVAIIAGSSIFLIKELKNGTLSETLTIIQKRLNDLASEIKDTAHMHGEKVKNGIDAALHHAGVQLGNGFGAGLVPHAEKALVLAEEHASTIGRNATAGAFSAVAETLPLASVGLESAAGQAGQTFATRFMETVEAKLPALTESVAASLRNLPGLLFRRTGRK